MAEAISPSRTASSDQLRATAAFDGLSPNYLGRFVRRDGRTHTWDAEVSQLLDPPVLVQGTNFRMRHDH